MRKRFLSLLCVLALCLGLLPVTALAEENAPTTLYVGSTTITAGYWTSSDGGKVWTSPAYEPEGNNYIYYDGQGTLKLHNVTIQGADNTGSPPYGAGIYALCSQGQPVALTIKLIGENTITGYYGIYVNAEISADSNGTDASLTITSENNGSLEVSGSNYGIFVKSGTGNASLNIEKATVTSSTDGEYAAGVNVQSSANATGSPNISLSVNGGSLTASGTGNSDGILFYVGHSQATGATTSLTITDHAIVDARNGGISASRTLETLPTPTPTGNNSSGIVFDDKNGTVYGNVTLDESLTINQGETLTVPDGSKLDCNNNLTNKGTILVETGGTVSGNLSGGTGVTTPSITAQPTDQTVTEGSAAEFSVTASDAQTYQWQQSADNGQSWTDIDGATNDTYSIEATITSMSDYQYRCVVTSASGVSVTSAAATLTVQAKPASVPVTGVKLDKTSLTLQETGSDTLTATVEPADATNKDVTWASSNSAVATVDATGNVKAVGAGTATITVTTEDGEKTATCTVTVEKPYTPPPYIPPSKTPSQQAIDKIEDAKEGSTVKITLRTGQTKLDKEVFEELAGRDVTLKVNLPGGITWTVNGKDIPADAALTDIDMGVSLNTSDIPVDVINMVTGEKSTVQLSLAHDGEFGFTLTLTAPVGTENKGLWANLYHYNTTKKQMLFETSAQVDSSGNVALKFTHASEYAIVLDEKSHELPFTDTVEGAWYQGAVEYVYRNGIMTGTSATTFEPNAPLSRAMVAQILYNLEGQPAVEGESTFTDASTHWAVDAITWAQETGVVNGYEDNTFRPNRAVTREELAQMLYNYAKVKGYDLTTSGDLTAFPDGSKVSVWAKTAMAWANGNQLINGFEDDTLRPGGDSTRAQAASILMNFDVNLAN